MGRWTPQYSDDVLRYKVKRLVNGAVRRHRLEHFDKTDVHQPLLNYEAFVDELDLGDAFTSSIIDILVHEIADRRSRSNVDDRKLINHRTMRSLRKLSSDFTVYRDRTHNHDYASTSHDGSNTLRRVGSRRSISINDYLTEPPRDMGIDDDDDDDFESMLDSTSSSNPPEGMRANTELYHAYSSDHDWSLRPRRFSSFFGGVNETAPFLPPPSRSPPASHRVDPWNLPPRASTPTASSFNRPSSLRRPAAGTRTSDFHYFTSQRRSSTRQNAEGSGREGSPADSTSREPTTEQPVPSSSPSRSLATRRFFPLNRARRSVASFNPTAGDDEFTGTFHMLPTPSTSSPSSQNDPADEVEGDNAATVRQARTLRRGGILAPESTLFRRASPLRIVMLGTPPAEEQRNSHPPELGWENVLSTSTENTMPPTSEERT